MKIPMIIHYCWFGGKPLTEHAAKCMESWKKHCPDFEVMCWDESKISKFNNRFLCQAIEAHKWAFAADYVRLMALYDFGGIYLDTDVEIIRHPMEFMDNEMFLGFESRDRIATAVIGSVPGHPFIKLLAEEYSVRSLLLPDGSIDYTPNVVYFTRELVKRGLITDNSRQNIDGIVVYPSDYFSPKSLDTGRICVTDNTCTIHHFNASWLPFKKRANMRIAQIIGPELTRLIKKMTRRNNDE